MFSYKLRFFIAIVFLSLFLIVKPQLVEAQSPEPTFTSLGDCEANALCPSPEPTVEVVQPVNEQPQSVQPQIQQRETPDNSTLITILQQLLEFIKQLLGDGGQGGCPTDSQVASNSVDESVISANSRGKKKWKKKKKGLYKKIKCPGQDGGNQNQNQQNEEQNGGQQQPVEQPVQQPVEQPTEQPVQQPVEQPTEQPAQQPTVAPSTAPAGGGGQAAGNLGACTGGPQATEPAHDYTRVQYGGRTVNVRTRNMLQIAEGFAESMGVPTPFTLSQGSYNTGVAASAGTHDGGGVVDISVNNMDDEQRNGALRALRMAGLTAWLRSPAEGFAYHIHANAIGDREMSSIAMSQVDNFFDGLNGLAGNGRDTAPASVGRPIPSWAAMYGTCR